MKLEEFSDQCRWRWRRLERLKMGILALSVLGVAVIAYFFAVLPQRAVLAQLERDIAIVPEAVPQPTAVMTVAPATSKFPYLDSLPKIMGNVFANAAEHSLVLDAGNYQLKRVPGGLVEYHAELPIKGQYPQIRRFVTEILRVQPNLALTSVSFARQRTSETTVEARVRFVVHLSAESQ